MRVGKSHKALSKECPSVQCLNESNKYNKCWNLGKVIKTEESERPGNSQVQILNSDISERPPDSVARELLYFASHSLTHDIDALIQINNIIMSLWWPGTSATLHNILATTNTQINILLFIFIIDTKIYRNIINSFDIWYLLTNTEQWKQSDLCLHNHSRRLQSPLTLSPV